MNLEDVMLSEDETFASRKDGDYKAKDLGIEAGTKAHNCCGCGLWASRQGHLRRDGCLPCNPNERNDKKHVHWIKL